MNKLNLDNVPVKNNNVIGRVLESGSPVEKEAVIVHPDRGKVDVLNDVGASIWLNIDGINTIRQIVSIICSEYEIDEITAEADVCEFLTGLNERDIIQFSAINQ